MTFLDLQAIQKEINLDAPTMAILCEVPYDTWKNYLYGVNSIPVSLIPKIMDVYYFNKGLTMSIPYEVERNLKGKFVPNTAIKGIW